MIAQPLHPFGGAAAWTGPGGLPRLAASAQRLPATLELTWTVASDGDDLGSLLRLPTPGPEPQRLDDLWRHTCFEAFVAVAEQEPYLELNLSPAGDWNVYGLEGYRRGLTPLAACTDLPARIDLQPRHLALAVTLPLPGDLATAPVLAVGLTAVLEDAAGHHTYWALHHPAAEADFHHRGGFTLLCPADDHGPR